MDCKECDIFKVQEYIANNRKFNIQTKCGKCIAELCLEYVAGMIENGSTPASLFYEFKKCRDYYGNLGE